MKPKSNNGKRRLFWPDEARENLQAIISEDPQARIIISSIARAWSKHAMGLALNLADELFVYAAYKRELSRNTTGMFAFHCLASLEELMNSDNEEEVTSLLKDAPNSIELKKQLLNQNAKTGAKPSKEKIENEKPVKDKPVKETPVNETSDDKDDPKDETPPVIHGEEIDDGHIYGILIDKVECINEYDIDVLTPADEIMWFVKGIVCWKSGEVQPLVFTSDEHENIDDGEIIALDQNASRPNDSEHWIYVSESSCAYRLPTHDHKWFKLDEFLFAEFTIKLFEVDQDDTLEDVLEIIGELLKLSLPLAKYLAPPQLAPLMQGIDAKDIDRVIDLLQKIAEKLQKNEQLGEGRFSISRNDLKTATYNRQDTRRNVAYADNRQAYEYIVGDADDPDARYRISLRYEKKKL